MMMMMQMIVMAIKVWKLWPDLLEDFLRLIRLSGILHVNKVGIVFALFVIGERRVVADPIVPNLEAIYISLQIGMDVVEKAVDTDDTCH